MDVICLDDEDDDNDNEEGRIKCGSYPNKQCKPSADLNVHQNVGPTNSNQTFPFLGSKSDHENVLNKNVQGISNKPQNVTALHHSTIFGNTVSCVDGSKRLCNVQTTEFSCYSGVRSLQVEKQINKEISNINMNENNLKPTFPSYYVANNKVSTLSPSVIQNSVAVNVHNSSTSVIQSPIAINVQVPPVTSIQTSIQAPTSSPINQENSSLRKSVNNSQLVVVSPSSNMPLSNTPWLVPAMNPQFMSQSANQSIHSLSTMQSSSLSPSIVSIPATNINSPVATIQTSNLSPSVVTFPPSNINSPLTTVQTSNISHSFVAMQPSNMASSVLAMQTSNINSPIVTMEPANFPASFVSMQARNVPHPGFPLQTPNISLVPQSSPAYSGSVLNQKNMSQLVITSPLVNTGNANSVTSFSDSNSLLSIPSKNTTLIVQQSQSNSILESLLMKPFDSQFESPLFSDCEVNSAWKPSSYENSIRPVGQLNFLKNCESNPSVMSYKILGPQPGSSNQRGPCVVMNQFNAKQQQMSSTASRPFNCNPPSSLMMKSSIPNSNNNIRRTVGNTFLTNANNTNKLLTILPKPLNSQEISKSENTTKPTKTSFLNQNISSPSNKNHKIRGIESNCNKSDFIVIQPKKVSTNVESSSFTSTNLNSSHSLLTSQKTSTILTENEQRCVNSSPKFSVVFETPRASKCNSAELMEKADDKNLSSELVFSLPVELSKNSCDDISDKDLKNNQKNICEDIILIDSSDEDDVLVLPTQNFKAPVVTNTTLRPTQTENKNISLKCTRDLSINPLHRETSQRNPTVTNKEIESMEIISDNVNIIHVRDEDEDSPDSYQNFDMVTVSESHVKNVRNDDRAIHGLAERFSVTPSENNLILDDCIPPQTAISSDLDDKDSVDKLDRVFSASRCNPSEIEIKDEFDSSSAFRCNLSSQVDYDPTEATMRYINKIFGESDSDFLSNKNIKEKITNNDLDYLEPDKKLEDNVILIEDGTDNESPLKPVAIILPDSICDSAVTVKDEIPNISSVDENMKQYKDSKLLSNFSDPLIYSMEVKTKDCTEKQINFVETKPKKELSDDNIQEKFSPCSFFKYSTPMSDSKNIDENLFDEIDTNTLNYQKSEPFDNRTLINKEECDLIDSPPDSSTKIEASINYECKGQINYNASIDADIQDIKNASSRNLDEKLKPNTALNEVPTNDKPFICSHCGFGVAIERNLDMHIKAFHSKEIKGTRNNKNKKSSLFKRKSKVNHTQLHRCSQCVFQTYNSLKLTKHLKTEHGVFSCFKCSFAVDNEEDLKHHEGIHKSVKCALCEARILSSKYKDHLASAHPTTYRFKCDECDYKTNVEWKLRNHRKNNTHGVENLATSPPIRCSHVCSVCGFRASNDLTLSRHQKLNHFQPGHSYICLYCPYSTADKKDMTKHKLKVHQSESCLACNVCSFSTTKLKSLNNHMKSHHDTEKRETSDDSTSDDTTDEDIIQCKHCDFETNNESAIKEHCQQNHEGKCFLCNHCTENVTEVSNLSSPDTKESGKSDISYKCQYCSFNDNKLSSLNEHKYKVHSNELPFSCRKCIYRSRTSQNLERHERAKHKLVRRCYTLHKCKYCNFKTSELTLLTKHNYKVHCSKYVYKCNLCSYRSSRAYDLNKHCKNVHISKLTTVSNKLYSNKNISRNYGRVFYPRKMVDASKEQQIDLNFYFCRDCDYKSTEISNYERHWLLIHDKCMCCPICPSVLNSVNSLYDHKFEAHPDYYRHKCIYCSYCSKEKATLVTHEKTIHKAMTCYYCKSTFCSVVDFNDHIKSSHRDKVPHNCDKCGYQTMSDEYLKEHYSVMHTPLICEDCNFSTDSKMLIRNHIRESHPKKAPFACKKCLFRSLNEIGLSNHLLSCHINKCNLCRFKASSSLELGKHKFEFHKSEYFRFCLSCSYQTSPEVDIALHEINVHSYRTYRCSTCFFYTDTYNALKSHISMLHSDQPINNLRTISWKKCQSCEFYTTSTGRFYKHLKQFHSDQYMWPCNKCPFTSKTKARLQAHSKKSHKRSKIYKCDHCSFEIDAYSEFKNHLHTTHSQKYPFICHLCSYRGNSKDLLKKHIMYNHIKYR